MMLQPLHTRGVNMDTCVSSIRPQELAIISGFRDNDRHFKAQVGAHFIGSGK